MSVTNSRLKIVLATLFMVSACAIGGDDSSDAVSHDSTALAAPDSPAPNGARRSGGLGILFDAAAVHVGDTIGSMVVTRVDLQRAVAMPDSPYVGTIAFRGATELSGSMMQHPDPELKEICFEADPETAVVLPRINGDTRRPWFCFSNHAFAAERTASATAADRLRIRIDDFTINRSLSDSYNEARLLAVTDVAKDKH